MAPPPIDRADFLCRILDGGGIPVGTGFQFGAGVVVTAWHVVRDAQARGAGAELVVDPLHTGGRAVPAAVHAVDEAHDLAVLVCSEPLAAGVAELAASDSVDARARVGITGVAKFVNQQAFRYTHAVGTWLGTALRQDEVALGQVEAKAVVQGMSGGPVRRLEDGLVVGVVSSRYNSPDQWMRNTVWVARTEDLVPLLSGVVALELHGTPQAPGAWRRPERPNMAPLIDRMIERPDVAFGCRSSEGDPHVAGLRRRRP
jgi:S1-C subfamily serine protease